MARFPKLVELYGQPVQEKSGTNSELGRVLDVSEDFLAATLGELGCPEAPTVYVTEESRFWSYSPSEGIYLETNEATLMAKLSDLLLQCARVCSAKFDTTALAFKFRDCGNLRGVMARARGLLAVGSDFFQSDLTEFIPCANGMLRLKDRKLLKFKPEYRRRNKLAVKYQRKATCPLFLECLMKPALEPSSLDLLQRAAGQFLMGVNMTQHIVLLTGTPGGGKGTFVRVINGIIGPTNVGTLRPDHLGDRFELGRLLGKSLLYGADVPANFLNCKGASVLKALTGGDPVTLEFKGSNERPQIVCRFNALMSCNSRLTVRLEGDAGAWRRRLIIIEYRQPAPAEIIADLSERILAKEASGVLNWLLEGLDKLRADNWQLRLDSEHQKLVDDLLNESQAALVFARECLEKSPDGCLTVADAHAAYVDFCLDKGWIAMPRKPFSTMIGDAVAGLYGLTVRNDIPDSDNKNQRGWKGLRKRIPGVPVGGGP